MTIEPFATRDFNAQLQRTLGKAYVGAASIGEVMAAVAAIGDGDLESWHAVWRELGDQLEVRGNQERAAGRGETARRLFFRATEAFRQASFFHRVDLDCEELQSAWRRSETCLQAAMALTSHVCEPVQIPFEGRYLYGYMIVPDAGAAPWPTIFLPGGYDSSVEEAVLMNGLSALSRGYAVIAVDGPGQGKTLYDAATRAFMRPDYETVMTAVIDFALTRPEVDPDRLVAFGCSFGGYLIPRGAAGEKRLSALVADPGQFDLGAAILAMLAPELVERIDEDGEDAMADFEKLAAGPDGALLFRPRMAAHGLTTVQDYIRHMREFNNSGSAPLITCPSLICDNEIDRISTGQGKQLANAMTGSAVDTVIFTAAEGAGGHCEGMGREVFDERVYPWLDKTLGLIG